jgi:hypothetical protein
MKNFIRCLLSMLNLLINLDLFNGEVIKIWFSNSLFVKSILHILVKSSIASQPLSKFQISWLDIGSCNWCSSWGRYKWADIVYESLSLILEFLKVSRINLRDLLSDHLFNRIWGCRRHLNTSIDIYFDWSRSDERLRMTYRIIFDSTGINHLYILRDWILTWIIVSLSDCSLRKDLLFLFFNLVCLEY